MSERWIPGKRYDFYKGKDKAANYQFQKNSELQGAFHVSLYIVMEDGSQIGFKYGTSPADETVDAFNLYRLDADGKATYLGASIQSGVETLYVQDGFTCGKDASGDFKVKID
ncbi:MAG: hypothetical protein IKW40_01225 [Anaerotignum sp.]|nr:hypothetical protein [Anaerotignum sp.]